MQETAGLLKRERGRTLYRNMKLLLILEFFYGNKIRCKKIFSQKEKKSLFLESTQLCFVNDVILQLHPKCTRRRRKRESEMSATRRSAETEEHGR